MNISQQILHVWRKDWHRTRWMFLLLCVTTAVCVIKSRPAAGSDICQSTQSCDGGMLALMQLIMAIVAMVFVASIIQDDSPTDDTSFWVTHPISVKALLGEKLLYVLGSIVAITVIAQTTSLFLNGFELWPSLPSMGVTLYWVVSLVLASMLLAATGRNTQVFILLAIGCLLLRFIQFSGFFDLFRTTPLALGRESAGFRADVWLLLASILVTWIYLAQTVRRRTRIYVTSAALAVLTVGWDSGSVRGIRFFTTGVEHPNPNPPAIQYSAIRSDRNILIRISTKAPPTGRRYTIACPSYVLRFPDRRTLTPIQLVGCGEWAPATAQPLKRYTSRPGADSVTATIVLPLLGSSEERQLSQSTVIVVDAFLEEQSEDQTTQLPIGSEVVVAHGSRRFTRTYHQALVGGTNFERLEFRIQNAYQRVTRIPLDISMSKMANPAKNVHFGNEQLTENGYDIRAISSSGADTMKMSVDSGQSTATRSENARWNTVSLAIPGRGVARFRGILMPECDSLCGKNNWRNRALVVTAWKHVQYAPLHLEIPYPLR